MNVCSSSPSRFHGKLVGGAVCNGPIPQLKNVGGFPAVSRNKRRVLRACRRWTAYSVGVEG
jgi:hypothetical protein